MPATVEVEVAGRWGAWLAKRAIHAAPVRIDFSGEGGRDGSR